MARFSKITEQSDFKGPMPPLSPNFIPLLDIPLYQTKSTVTEKGGGHFWERKPCSCRSRGETWKDSICETCRNVCMSRIEARCLKLQEPCRPGNPGRTVFLKARERVFRKLRLSSELEKTWLWTEIKPNKRNDTIPPPPPSYPAYAQSVT